MKSPFHVFDWKVNKEKPHTHTLLRIPRNSNGYSIEQIQCGGIFHVFSPCLKSLKAFFAPLAANLGNKMSGGIFEFQ